MGVSATHRAIEAVWRIEAARLIAGLARTVRDVGLAEELAQDALVVALEKWPESGVPDNPGAWLMAVARRRWVDSVRRSVTLERKVEGLRQFEREYRTRLKAYLETQLRELEGRSTEAPGGGRPGGQQPAGQQPAGAQSGQPQGGDQQRSPFTAGAPVGQPSGDNPGGPPQQASSGFQLEDNNQDRGN